MVFVLACAAAVVTARAEGFVSVQGARIVDAQGRPLLLRGINLGNWLVPEGYMFEFKKPNSPRLVEQVASELLGPEEARTFWIRHQDNFITREDITLIGRLGFNSVRVPFNYRLFTPENQPGVFTGRGFELLDRLVDWCRAEKLLVLLDLHCAPGGQTGDNIDDGWGYPFLFECAADQDRTVELWRRVARHYKDEPAILGYDLLNEPIAHFFDTTRLNPLLEPLYRRITAAVRETDRRHLVFLGGAQWDSNFKVFGPPFDGKSVYTFHKYWTAPTREVIQDYLDFSERHHVPLYMGESGENNNDWIRQFRQTLEANGVGWCFWPYKKVAAESCVVRVKRPEHYEDLLRYAEAPRATFEEIRAARAASPHAAEALRGLVAACRLSAAEINSGYVEALGLKTVPIGR